MDIFCGSLCLALMFASCVFVCCFGCLRLCLCVGCRDKGFFFWLGLWVGGFGFKGGGSLFGRGGI